MPAAPLLRVRDLSITHRDAREPAVRDVSFEVSAGEVVLLLGPSGSGKSTLALALSGLIPHSLDAEVSGAVEVCGHDAAATPIATLSRSVSTVFQDPDAQIVTGSVLDDAAFAPENLLLPVPEVLSRAEAALRRLGLWDRRSENPDRLSGGGKQRLAIASALTSGSPVLILDEPTANLDPQGTADVHAALADLAGAGDRAIVLVEHDLDQALEVATRAIVLDRSGRIAFDGPARRILREHAEEILALGAWLPSAALAARRLNAAGIPVGTPLPLTPDELRSALRGTASGSEAREKLDPLVGSGDLRASHAEAAITVRGLDVSRGGTAVLRGVDLEVETASITAVVGANGAGKTSLVQALAGVLTPPRGRVSVDGIDPATASPAALAAHIGFVFQNPEHQFIAHTVFDELAHGLRLRHVPPAEVAERVAAMLERFGLSAEADVHPFLLSGGEKRRLSVGTALIARPRILVLDEPTFGQDRARTEELLALFRELRAEGTTIVLVTHDRELVVQHTTHAVVVDDGTVVAAGPTAELVRDGRIPLPEAFAAVPPALRELLVDAPRADAVPTAPADAPEDPPATTAPPAPVRIPGTAPTAKPAAAAAATAVTAAAGSDPYAEHAAVPARAWLHHLNPLAKLAAVLPAMVLLVFVRDLATPAAFLALAYAVLVTGTRLTARIQALLLLAIPAGVLVLTLSMALWTDPAQVAATPVALQLGAWTLHAGALHTGLATGLRLAAILALALISGLTTTGPDVVRAGVQQLRIPYRIGYTALAAYRFVPRFGYELSVIRAAHRVRGTHGGRGPFARIARGWGYIVPLLASAIRHAERVALAMDARAFGAYPTRTERHEVPFRIRDVVFVALMLAVSAAIFALFFPWQLQPGSEM